MSHAALPGLVLLLLLLAVWPGSATAQIYRYTDERGNSVYVDGLDNVPERYRSRAVPLGLRNVPSAPSPAPVPGAPPAGAPPAGTPARARTAQGGTTIRFSPGERIMVDARINGRGSARLILDTGADRTVVAPRALMAAGASLTRGTVAGQITGVTGSTDVQGVSIDSLEIGDARVGRLLVISHDVNQPGIDGLLGRDFLEQFTVTIDSSRGLVTLAPK